MDIGSRVLYKNNQLIAFNKWPGVPVQSDKTGDKALLDLARIYTKSKLQLIHRIDRPASGIVLLAKTPRALAHLNEQFRQQKIQKRYLAVVKNKPDPASGELRHFLKKNARLNRSFVSDTPNDKAKEAHLKYRYISSSEQYHLLEIELITGRHHQIRAQLGALANPIKGDVKYGFRRSNKDRSIHLHAWKMSFRHPVSAEVVQLTAAPPDDPVWNAFELGL